MSSDTPFFDLPLQRLWQAQQHTLYKARECYRKDLTFVQGTLTFRPDVMQRVAEEAPALTDPARLRAIHIRMPEWSHRSGHEWTLQVDMSYIFQMRSNIGWPPYWDMFGEFILYNQGSLDRLTDPDLPFDVAPTTIVFPPLCDTAFS